MRKDNFFIEYAATLENSWVETDKLKQDILYFFVKRCIDILFAITGLFITSPIILIFAILIKIESKGPAFFFQERVGYQGKYFNVIKLRSMTLDAEKNGAQWAQQNDPRVTKIGAFIRKTRIDELPQLINIIVGDMSVVGPRPERPIFTAQFNQEIPGFIERLTVKPGLTGWAQINGGYDLTPEQKLKLDDYYIKNYCLSLDIKIILKTVLICFSGDGAR
ncbi:exopolysaccharide biosynthesis polyprenyl glycosylphosphotransferase [Fictibacillus solisalsi]|uniref:Exopolysaccharide biosynthesis polyprenyl glycosylphosphotransferase n=1 Tax=Fictibacillus solisalsi TaxID=459525 RepID=A0A1G9YIW8_9BACL|nr:exopolysaccharide biosynthesis polyprenyl glycosylphosphotransferase [Fictibacillus solisalsi]SDN09094.1 exopolysaccharide biosynthesis polyprenyl glycosylphosphotransferase [Fictibacillus solisalsi]